MSQVPADPRETLLRYLRVQRITDVQINALLRRAARDLANQIENIAPTSFADSVKLAQLRIQQRAIANALWSGTGSATADGKLRAIVAATAGGDADLQELLRGIPAEARQALLDGAERAARDAIERAVARLGGRAVTDLSTRVYRNSQLMAGQVDRLINSGIARGLSPRELAAEARKYILPSTPGGVSYSALRLGRTEVNNSFHAATAAYHSGNPFVTGMQWNLSGSHPHSDICDEYAHENHDRLGDGVFKTENVPPKPHPQCFCYVIPVTPDDDQIVNKYLKGDYDDFLRSQQVTARALADPEEIIRTYMKSGASQTSIRTRLVRQHGMTTSEADKAIRAVERGTVRPSKPISPRPSSVARPVARPTAVPSGPLSSVELRRIVNVLTRQSEVEGVVSRTAREIDAKYLRQLKIQKVSGDTRAAFHSGHTINIDSAEFGKAGEARALKAKRSGFWADTDGASGLESTVAHEIGHELSNALPRPVRVRLFEDIARELKVAPPNGLSELAREKWLAANKAKVAKALSRYGTESPEELLAEAWSEFLLNRRHARPIAKLVGLAFKSALG